MKSFGYVRRWGQGSKRGKHMQRHMGYEHLVYLENWEESRQMEKWVQGAISVDERGPGCGLCWIL